MGTRTPSVWQISGGPVGRPYADIFLKFGVALLPSLPTYVRHGAAKELE